MKIMVRGSVTWWRFKYMSVGSTDTLEKTLHQSQSLNEASDRDVRSSSKDTPVINDELEL